MRKHVVVFLAIAFLLVFALPVCAESGFQKASDWIATWGKPCTGEAKPCVPAASGKEMKGYSSSQCYTLDPLGNKVPTKTIKGGKTMLGQ